MIPRRFNTPVWKRYKYYEWWESWKNKFKNASHSYECSGARFYTTLNTASRFFIPTSETVLPRIRNPRPRSVKQFYYTDIFFRYQNTETCSNVGYEYDHENSNTNTQTDSWYLWAILSYPSHKKTHSSWAPVTPMWSDLRYTWLITPK